MRWILCHPCTISPLVKPDEVANLSRNHQHQWPSFFGTSQVEAEMQLTESLNGYV
jgi:hypothetical protein